MNADEKKQLKEAFNAWAKSVPDPDAPVMGFMSTKMFSAREMAAEVEKETEAGKSILEVLEHGVNVEGIDKVVARLTRNIPKP